MERSTEGQKIEQRCVAVGDGQLVVATRKCPDATNPGVSQDPTGMALPKIPNKGESPIASKKACSQLRDGVIHSSEKY